MKCWNVSMKRFCDFCPCNDCKYGWHDMPDIGHAPTDDGRWICDICYSYDECTKGSSRNPKGPCEDENCKHRPKLIGPFIKQTKEENQMCDTCKEHTPETVDEEYPLPVDHPRLAAVAGWLYDHICEPVNKAIEWVANGFHVVDEEEEDDTQ